MGQKTGNIGVGEALAQVYDYMSEDTEPMDDGQMPYTYHRDSGISSWDDAMKTLKDLGIVQEKPEVYENAGPDAPAHPPEVPVVEAPPVRPLMEIMQASGLDQQQILEAINAYLRAGGGNDGSE